MELDRRACDRARWSRDARFDGRFFIAVTSSGIYCRPICSTRHAKDEHVRYLPSAAAAKAAGFRPCLRCRPEAASGSPAGLGTSGLVSRALRLISEGALTRRVHFAKKLLDETSLSLGQVAFASGFGSRRRFNGQIRRTYARTPTQLRRLARQHAGAEPERYRFRLAYRPPYDWEGVLAFLAARAIPGVESVEGSRSRCARPRRGGRLRAGRAGDPRPTGVRARGVDRRRPRRVPVRFPGARTGTGRRACFRRRRSSPTLPSSARG